MPISGRRLPPACRSGSVPRSASCWRGWAAGPARAACGEAFGHRLQRRVSGYLARGHGLRETRAAHDRNGVGGAPCPAVRRHARGRKRSRRLHLCMQHAFPRNRARNRRSGLRAVRLSAPPGACADGVGRTGEPLSQPVRAGPVGRPRSDAGRLTRRPQARPRSARSGLGGNSRDCWRAHSHDAPRKVSHRRRSPV